MIKFRYQTIAMLLVIAFGFGLFYFGTDGFTAFTAETARVKQLEKDKPLFPDAILEDSKQRTYSIAEFSGKYVLITFFYSSCPTVCVELERNMAQVYNEIPAESIGKHIQFLSVSFDPARDSPARLEEYREFFHSDGETWRMARINDQDELDNVLKKFGVIVIPDERGGFSHNAAFYLLDKQGRLAEVMDYTKPTEAAAKVMAAISRAERGGVQ